MTYRTWTVGDAVIEELDRPGHPTTRCITQLAFIERFTDEEAIAIDIASRADTQEAAQIRRYLQKVQFATAVDLDGENVRDGVPALEAIGLIAEGRAVEIMDAEVRPHEIA